MTALAPFTSLPEGSITPQGLMLPAGTSFESALEIGRTLGLLRDFSSFATGDWLIEVERLFGENHLAQAVEVTGLAKSTLLNRRRVSERVPLPRRRGELSWSHHEAIASLPDDAQDALLASAVEGGWSVEELRGMRPEKAVQTVRRGLRQAALDVVGAAFWRVDCLADANGAPTSGWLVADAEFQALKEAVGS